MSTYSEKLDEILHSFAKRVEKIPRGKTYGWDEEKQAINQLFLETIKEAKPTKTENGYKLSEESEDAVYEYEQNILKIINGGNK